MEEKNSTQTNSFLRLPGLGHGVGLRSEHFQAILETQPPVDWFEAISENFMDTEGRPLTILEKIRANYPIGLHGTSLSIGSTDRLHPDYLQKLKKLADRIQPAIISDHLCWSSHQDERLFDLLPLPFTQESMQVVVNHLDQLQNFLGRRVLLENVSAYVSFKHSEMPEWEYLNQIAKKSGCGILLDVNNIYVNSFNHGFNSLDYLKGIRPEFVGQYHISGHTNRGKFLFDTHVGEIIQEVWELYAEAVKRFGDVSSLIEWDTEIRSFDELQALNEKSRVVAQQAPSRPLNPEESAEPVLPKLSVPSFQTALKEIQSWFTQEMLKKNKTHLAEILNEQAGDSGIERVEVYAEGYPARINEALLENYPAICKVVGDARFAELTGQFAAAGGFHHYNLSRVADHFPYFLQAGPWNVEYPFLRDLAELELAVKQSFHAEIKPAATGSDFFEKAQTEGENLIFEFQEHVFGVRSFWPILDIWNARHLPLQEIKIQMESRPQAVLIYRRGEKVFCQKAEALEVAVLNQLKQGKPLGEAFEVMTEAEDMTPVQTWFANWLSNGLIMQFKTGANV